MFDNVDDELIKRLIAEAEALLEEEIQKYSPQEQVEILEEMKQSQEALMNDVAKPKRTRKKAAAQEEAEVATPKKRGRPKKVATQHADDAMTEQADNEKPAKKRTRKKPIAKSITKEEQNGGLVVKEAVLEFVEREDGVLTLQEVGNEDEPMLTIAFSEQIKQIIGDDVQMVGQSMIHAALATVMQRQMSAYHAHIYDEKPTRYS